LEESHILSEFLTSTLTIEFHDHTYKKKHGKQLSGHR
jgi:hypothetical protein